MGICGLSNYHTEYLLIIYHGGQFKYILAKYDKQFKNCDILRKLKRKSMEKVRFYSLKSEQSLEKKLKNRFEKLREVRDCSF